MQSWKDAGKEIDSLNELTADEFASMANGNDIAMFDVRKQSECDLGIVKNAKHTPLTDFNTYMDKFSTQDTSYVYCGGGYRSVIAISILKSRGIHNTVNVLGGYAAI
jgi:rhodanese-related sulfurtransferase